MNLRCQPRDPENRNSGSRLESALFAGKSIETIDVLFWKVLARGEQPTYHNSCAPQSQISETCCGTENESRLIIVPRRNTNSQQITMPKQTPCFIVHGYQLRREPSDRNGSRVRYSPRTTRAASRKIASVGLLQITAVSVD